MSREFLILNLAGPLMSYGGVALDQTRPCNDFPTKSMITGLLSNALGWDDRHLDRSQRLQNRISMASRNEAIVPGGNQPLWELHTASLRADDLMWSPSGVPVGRRGSPKTYNSPVMRHTEYRTDLRTVVAIGLEPEDESPTASELAQALMYPKKVLFIGRKTCLPSEMIYLNIALADNHTEALHTVKSRSADPQDPVQWDGDENHHSVAKTGEQWMSDLRDWPNRVHTGRRMVNVGLMTKGTGDAGDPSNAGTTKDREETT